MKKITAVKPVAIWVGVASLAALTYFVASILAFRSLTFDDAYIHFRIARNISDGFGPYFHPGEKVMGSSPHLWINALAALFSLFGASRDAAVPLEILAIGLVFSAGAMLLSSRMRPWAAVACSFAITAAYSLNIASGLMESPLALGLILASALFLEKGRTGWAGLLAGISCWVRFECILWTFFAALVSRQKPRFLAAAAGPGLALASYCLFFFGTVLPQPMIAKGKIHQIGLQGTLLNFGFPDLFDLSRIPASLENHFMRANVTDPLRLLAVLALVAMTALLARASLNRTTPKEKFPVWAVALFLSGTCLFLIHLVRGTVIFQWYWPIILTPVALATLALRGRKRWLAFSLLVLSTSGWWISAGRDAVALATGRNNLHTYYFLNTRTGVYLKIGAWLRARDPKGVIATNEIGALGWNFRGRILDGVGIITPEMVRYHQEEQRIETYLTPAWWRNFAVPWKAIVDFKPRFFVSFPVYERQFLYRLAKDPTFPKYTLIARYPLFSEPDANMWGDHWIEVYELTPG